MANFFFVKIIVLRSASIKRNKNQFLYGFVYFYYPFCKELLLCERKLARIYTFIVEK